MVLLSRDWGFRVRLGGLDSEVSISSTIVSPYKAPWLIPWSRFLSGPFIVRGPLFLLFRSKAGTQKEKGERVLLGNPAVENAGLHPPILRVRYPGELKVNLLEFFGVSQIGDPNLVPEIVGSLL